jgi:glycosyltransferase involved in cell wall biosynthesis
MQKSINLAYLSNLSSPYDTLFLKWLTKTYNVTCITFNHNPRSFPQTISVIRIKDSPFKLPRTDGIRIWALTFSRTFLLKQLLNKTKPDIIIGNNALSYGFYSALTSFKPHFLFVWGSDVLIWPKKSAIFKSVVEHSLKKADAILVDSNVQAKACLRLGAAPDKIVKIPWFDINDVRNIQIKNEDRTKIRLNLGISEDETVIISTRSHEQVYSVETLILAVSKVVDHEQKVKFLIVGGGSKTPNLKRLAEKQGVLEKVVFTGKTSRKKVLQYLQLSDLYVSTSLSDGTSASLLEAMACKIPPIVTDIPGNREWIKNGENGLLFPVKDYKALAENIIKLLKDDATKKSLGKKAHDTVVKKANWRKNSKLLDDLIYSMVLNN